jgi:phosphate transport system substrate-binding protein
MIRTSRRIPPARSRSSRLGLALLTAFVVASVGSSTRPIEAAPSYQRISGEGSSWSANAIDAMRVNVQQFGITVDYNATGSTAGRKNFLNGTVDFAASDIPFQFEPEDGSAPENPAPGSYAYMPVTAGGTAFMYNLKINGARVTNLRLSGENAAKIFTGAIKTWNDPAIQADNPGLTMPARNIVPVVRAEGSGSTQQLTAWMIDRHPAVWQEYCQRSGRAPSCGPTSFYPTVTGMISQSGDLGVSGYVSQGFAEGSIGYVNYSYALGTQFPVVKMLNAAGFYTEPTPENVAVSLLKSRINTDESNPAKYLTQDLSGVYTDTDPRSYQLSSYSYLILPTKVGGQFNEAKGLTLGAFAYYAMCQAQQSSASLGYSPMPVNLVEASFEQIRKIPGVQVQDIDITQCKNPTFSADGTNVLAQSAPQPQGCDKQGPTQCPNGTGGLSNVPTAVLASATAPPAAGGGAGTPAAGGGAGTPAAGGGAGTPAAGGGAGTPAAGGGAGTPAAGGGAGTPAAGGGAGTPAAGGATTNTVLDASGAPVDAVTGAPVDPNAPGLGVVVFDPAACDPDTGVCGDGTGQQTAGPSAGAAVGAITTTTLSKGSGWDASLALVLLIVILTVGVVLVPALAWGYFSGRTPA